MIEEDDRITASAPKMILKQKIAFSDKTSGICVLRKSRNFIVGGRQYLRLYHTISMKLIKQIKYEDENGNQGLSCHVSEVKELSSIPDTFVINTFEKLFAMNIRTSKRTHTFPAKGVIYNVVEVPKYNLILYSNGSGIFTVAYLKISNTYQVHTKSPIQTILVCQNQKAVLVACSNFFIYIYESVSLANRLAIPPKVVSFQNIITSTLIGGPSSEQFAFFDTSSGMYQCEIKVRKKFIKLDDEEEEEEEENDQYKMQLQEKKKSSKKGKKEKRECKYTLELIDKITGQMDKKLETTDKRHLSVLEVKRNRYLIAYSKSNLVLYDLENRKSCCSEKVLNKGRGYNLNNIDIEMCSNSAFVISLNQGYSGSISKFHLQNI